MENHRKFLLEFQVVRNAARSCRARYWNVTFLSAAIVVPLTNSKLHPVCSKTDIRVLLVPTISVEIGEERQMWLVWAVYLFGLIVSTAHGSLCLHASTDCSSVEKECLDVQYPTRGNCLLFTGSDGGVLAHPRQSGLALRFFPHDNCTGRTIRQFFIQYDTCLEGFSAENVPEPDAAKTSPPPPPDNELASAAFYYRLGEIELTVEFPREAYGSEYTASTFVVEQSPGRVQVAIEPDNVMLTSLRSRVYRFAFPGYAPDTGKKAHRSLGTLFRYNETQGEQQEVEWLTNIPVRLAVNRKSLC